MQDELQTPRFESFLRVALRFPCALVPHHDRAAAVLTFGNGSFETAVLDGMVFYLNGKTLVAGIVAWPFRYCPAFQNTVPSEAEIIVQACCGVFLNHEW